MFERIANVTYQTAGFSRLKTAIESTFAYQVVHEGHVDESLAALWRAPHVCGQRYCILQAPNKPLFSIRLIEGPVTSTCEALKTFGWNASELLVDDVYDLAERLPASDFTVIGGPRDLMNNGAAIALQVLGPGGELFYLTQISGDKMQATYGAADCSVDRLFILVLGSSDSERSREFYKPLVTGVTRPRKFAIRVLSAAHGLDPDSTQYTISAACLPNQFRIEIDAYPDSCGPRKTEAGNIPPGLGMVSFEVASLDSLPLKLTIGQGPSHAPYYGCRVARTQGPDEEWIELLEAPNNGQLKS